MIALRVSTLDSTPTIPFLSLFLSVILLRSLLVPYQVIFFLPKPPDTILLKSQKQEVVYYISIVYFPLFILLLLPHFPTLFCSLRIGTQKWIGLHRRSKTLRLSGGSHFACQRRSFGFHLAGSGPSLL
jgi:hypothetical protein